MQLVLSMALAILVGLLSEYFVSERTEEQTRNAYLFALGLTLSILLSAFVHNHGFLQAQEIGELVSCKKYGGFTTLWHLALANLLLYHSRYQVYTPLGGDDWDSVCCRSAVMN